MKVSDQYHKWIEWSEEDQIYIGKCPDLITGIYNDHISPMKDRELPLSQIHYLQETA